MEVVKIYVIIVTYNGKQWYDRCFNSLRQSIIPIQIVVVDNASTDNTEDYITTNFPEVHLIKSEKNLGFGQGNNKGIRYALDNGADYFFLLNQDAWIEPNTLKILVELSENHREFGILSPMHLNAEKSKIETGLMTYIADHSITSTDFINDLYFNRLKNIYETKYVNAAAWLLPRKTIEMIGGFDPIFNHYGEDDNYLLRVQYHKLKVGLCPKSRIVHDTEKRIIDKKYIDSTSKKSLLVKFTDINQKIPITSFYFSSIFKAIAKMLRGRRSISKRLISEANYILRLRKEISKSRSQNKRIEESWLYKI